MRRLITTFVLLAAVAVSSVAYAGQAAAPPAKKSSSTTTAKPAAPAASHSVKGVVKSMDASSLVITKSGKDMTFSVGPDTKKDGAPAVGATVSVRYRTEGGSNIATAVTAQAPKTQAKK